MSVFVWSSTSRKHSPSPLTTDVEKEESEEDEYLERESGRGEVDDLKMERWALEVTHSAASSSASEMLSQSKGGLAAMDRPEKRLRSVIMISS